MRFTTLKATALAAFVSIGCAAAAHASVVVENLTLSATADTSFDIGGAPQRLWLLDPSLVTPFTVSSGDQLQVNVTFASPVTIVNGNTSVLGGAEGIIVGFNNQSATGAFAAPAGNAALSISGASGDFLGDPAPIYANGAGPGSPFEQFNTIDIGNLTNSIMTMTGFTMTFDIDSIQAQTAPFITGFLFLIDGTYPPDGVPAPGAVALLGLGLLGVAGMSRRARTIFTR